MRAEGRNASRIRGGLDHPLVVKLGSMDAEAQASIVDVRESIGITGDGSRFGLTATRWLARIPAVLVVSAAAIVAFWREVRARNGTVERPRTWTLALSFLGTTFVFLIVVVEERPMPEPGQWLTFLLLPMLILLVGMVRFPGGVPQRDLTVITAFFVIIAAASVHQTVTRWGQVPWQRDLLGSALPGALLVRQVGMACSTGAICAHALTLVVRRGDGFWAATRVSIFFAGALRLATNAILVSLGVDRHSASFPPTNLTLPHSVLVCSAYVLAALVCTPSTRSSLSWRFARFRCYVRSSAAMATTSNKSVKTADDGSKTTGAHSTAMPPAKPAQVGATGLCIICMDAPNDHAFLLCGHLCVCRECGQSVLEGSGQCPVCRSDVVAMLKTYPVFHTVTEDA